MIITTEAAETLLCSFAQSVIAAFLFEQSIIFTDIKELFA